MPRPSVPHDRLPAVRCAARPTPSQLLRAVALVAALLSLSLPVGPWRWPVALVCGAALWVAYDAACRQLDPPTAPAVVVTEPSPVQDLRASVDRLDRLTGRGAGLDELAEELHELERAVACLVGSQPRRPPSVVGSTRTPTGRASSATGEWTTTGVLR